MKSNPIFKFWHGVVTYPLGLVAFIWFVFWVQFHFDLKLAPYGIYPRRLEGIFGIIFSPFIHNSLAHLYQNTIPLFILSMAMIYFYRGLALRILFFGILFSGLLTWIIGGSGYHIGASGYIYVLFSFLVFRGLFSGYFRLVALALVIVFLYGGMIWFVLPIKDNMSWEGHLSGFVVGVLFAFWYRGSDIPQEQYHWESPDYDESKDDFLQQFDKQGNFIVSPQSTDTDPKKTINYTYNSDE